MRIRLLVLAAAILGGAARAQTSGSQAPDAKTAPAPPAAAAALPPNIWTGADYVMGSPEAKVTLVEYASASCPHCARFDAQVFPELKARYIDPGKVRYVFREFLTPPEQVAAAGFLLARCAGHDRYFRVVEQVFRAQPEIYATSDVKGVFVRIAKANGLSEAQLDACVSDRAALEALNARVQHAVDVDKIESTPSLVANGQTLRQEPGKEWTFAALAAQLDPLLKGAGSPAPRRRSPRTR